MTASLAGRVALVTGGDSGIGAACALELGRRGAAVCIADVGDVGPSEAVAEQVRALGAGALTVRMDVTDEAAVHDAFARCAAELGPVDLLVNNAGVEMAHPLVDMPLADWRTVLDVNLTGPFLCSREAARGMIAAGSGGTIVNMSSVHEHIPWRGFSHYCASKGGLRLFTQTIAYELAEHRIRVANVAPGAIDTPINRSVMDDAEQKAATEAEIPLGRWGEPEDVARAVAWLSGDEASYVTGTTLVVDGGMSLYPNFV